MVGHSGMNWARRAALVLAVGASLTTWAGTAAAEAAKTYTMKLGSLTINDEVYQWLKIFVAGIESKSGGRLKGVIFPSSQLGSAPREIEGTQFGAIQAVAFPPDFFSGVDERFEVASAPGTFSSLDQVNRVVFDPQFRKAFLSLGSNKGLIGLSLFVNAPVTVLTRKPVRRLADFKGLKIRILASDFQIQQIKRLDATPVAMSLGDVMPALQQGTIDGALASVPAFTPLHFYDAAKYMTETSQYYVLIVVEMSKKWFDTLPADLQKIILDEGTIAAHDIVPWAAQDLKDQKKVWTSHGGELIELPPKDEAELMKRMSTIAEDVGKKHPAIASMYQELKAAVKRNP
ncbi:MAG TPA: TRAP transporter substrate-binding protein [Stellaceae bacterium]|nr:TRAP transporter substrate-binding protein [Stellaceae bacterium]